uniref:Putative secreted protein n=1 Tax=Ixodes ricinus TaxID=34613 RepID=A0A6B0TVX7_IXORI
MDCVIFVLGHAALFHGVLADLFVWVEMHCAPKRSQLIYVLDPTFPWQKPMCAHCQREKIGRVASAKIFDDIDGGIICLQ